MAKWRNKFFGFLPKKRAQKQGLKNNLKLGPEVIKLWTLCPRALDIQKRKLKFETLTLYLFQAFDCFEI